MRPRAMVAILLLGAVFSACTEVTYRGDGLAADQVAFIEHKDAAVVAIDGRPVSGSMQRYEVRPGPRSVSIRVVAERDNVFGWTEYRSKRPLTVCFTARPGHVYLAMPEILGDSSWAPQIVDEETTYKVTAHAPGEPGWNCRSATPPPPSPDRDNDRPSD